MAHISWVRASAQTASTLSSPPNAKGFLHHLVQKLVNRNLCTTDWLFVKLLVMCYGKLSKSSNPRFKCIVYVSLVPGKVWYLGLTSWDEASVRILRGEIMGTSELSQNVVWLHSQHRDRPSHSTSTTYIKKFDFSPLLYFISLSVLRIDEMRTLVRNW